MQNYCVLNSWGEANWLLRSNTNIYRCFNFLVWLSICTVSVCSDNESNKWKIATKSRRWSRKEGIFFNILMYIRVKEIYAIKFLGAMSFPYLYKFNDQNRVITCCPQHWLIICNWPLCAITWSSLNRLQTTLVVEK